MTVPAESMRYTAAEVLERVFTTPNPKTGSLPPPHIAWVVFAHGTAFVSVPTATLPVEASFEALAEAARSAMRELGPVMPGSQAGDFGTTRLDGWFPTDPVWWVSYDHRDIVTVLTMDANDISVGLSGRARRQIDFDEQTIVEIRRFDGTKSTTGSSSFADDNNGFALAMYGQLRQRPGNLVFSPFSIRTALAMTLAGASDETAAQMREALCISSSDGSLHVTLAETVQRLNAAGGRDYEMAVASSLWGQDGATLQPDFRDLIARHYGGSMNLVDFHRDAEAARAAMNAWVEEKTRQKIRELVPPGSLSADTRLVVVNAVYFKALWLLQFRRAATADAPFHLEGGGEVQAPLMHQRDEVPYLQANGYQAVDLTYRGGDLSMLVLLPERKDGLDDLEKTLSARLLHDCWAQMRSREVNLFLPRFKITWGAVNVRDQLTALGMPLAFMPFQANFSGINGHEPSHEDSLFLSALFHKAFVETNEEGTEAAAATAAVMYLGAAPVKPPAVPLFRADHPFLFAIRERNTGVILFLGRVVDPTRET